MQLTSLPASRAEVEQEDVSDDEVLPLQSKVLQKMQALRGVPLSAESGDAMAKLNSISGASATRDATLAVFGAIGHGQDTLLLCVVEPPGVSGVPDWVYDRLGNHTHVSSGALRAGLTLSRQAARTQRFSASEKLEEAQPMSWEDAVRECIDDEIVQRTILESPGPPVSEPHK